MSLKDRCKQFIADAKRDETQNTLADALVAFVTTEIGRAADERFEDSVPLALYFATVEDREVFVKAINDAKPGMISKRWPR
jgi:hypothetical protein